MLSVIGDTLPIAVVIALNPLIIIVMVLMLLAPGGKVKSGAYLGGWITGIVALMGLVVLLASMLGDGVGDSMPTFAIIEILLGLALIWLAWKQWKRRPAPGEPAELLSWLAAADSMSPPAAFRLGLMISAANPKNIALVASAAIMVSAAELRTSAVIVVVLVFTLTTALSIGGPYLAYLVAPERVSQPIQELRGWLVQNSATILAVLFLVMGATVIGKGIGLI